MLIFIRPDQKTSLQKTKRPPLVHFVESVEEKEVFIENFYQISLEGKIVLFLKVLSMSI